MKRIALFLALILPAMSSFAQVKSTPKDAEGHTLISLWKSYDKAEKADRPQDQVKILESIKSEARNRHLAWDFYDAANLYVQVRSSINWKDRSDLRKAMEEEINSFDDPFLTFYYYASRWGNPRCAEYIQEHKKVLQKSYNPEFYDDDTRMNGLIYHDALIKRIKNDYEYALWLIHLKYDSDVLANYYKGVYPEEAFIEYSSIATYSDKATCDKLEEFSKKYSGKAVSLLSRQYCMSYRLRTLQTDNKSTAVQFKQLRADCIRFENDRKKFTGDEKLIADCCTNVEGIINTLDSSDIDASIDNGELSLRLRNISSVKLTVTDSRKGGAPLHTATVVNKANSYFVRDTVKYTLPDLNDGDYDIQFKTGNEEPSLVWLKHTLSIAIRPDSEGYRVFVADYISGEPVKTCDLTLTDADGKSPVTVNGVIINGFTPLPANLASKFSDKSARYLLYASYTDANGRYRCSGNVSATSPNPARDREFSNPKVRQCMLITDRRAFNPGETVRFKGVCYTGSYEYELCPKGVTVTAKLFDPERNLLASKELTTNDFGSVEGSFPLNTGSSRGGMYAIRLERDGNTIGSCDIRVDEFVLPTFSVTWDEDDRLYLPGDEITVRGKVTAYSGHTLGQAGARYEVSTYSSEIVSGDLELKQDGSFEIRFPSRNESYSRTYRINVTIVDATGETLEFSTTLFVNCSIPLSLELQNGVEGRYTAIPGKESRHYDYGSNIVRDDVASFLFDTGGLTREDLKISYKALSVKTGKVFAEGSAVPDDTVDLDVKGLPSGLYKIEVTASVPKADGSILDYKNSINFVKAADTDTALDMDVACFFKELGEDDIALQIGSTDGPVWAVVELFGDGNHLLDQQIVTLEGVRARKGSLRTVSYKRRAGWPEDLSIKVLWFRKGQCYRYSRRIQLPVTDLVLPLEFTRFRDSVRPGEEFSLLIKTEPGVECAATVFDKASETVAYNLWSRLNAARRYKPEVYYTVESGMNTSADFYFFFADSRSVGKDARVAFSMKSVNMSDELREEEVADSSAPQAVEEAALPEIDVRENFDATMAWEPCLRSDADGNIELKLKGGDRLSTYVVQLFAHAKGMRNAVLRKELQVTVPVKLAIVEPQFLYEGDIYTARVTLSSMLEEPVSGRIAVRFYDGKDWRNSRVLGTRTAGLTLSAGGSESFGVPFTVPEGISELGVLVSFTADDSTLGSDALLVSVPVYKPFQTLTEAHSALLRSGADKAALVSELRSLFVNIDASQLEPQERSILQMVREAIPDMVEPRSNNVLSLTEAWYANMIARTLGAPGLDDAAMAEILGKIASCQNASGGISWFEGMESSPAITAAVLQRMADIPGAKCSIDAAAAVKYLDDSYFGKTERPWWCGGISLEKYLHTRAMYPEVPFNVPSGKALTKFRKEVKAYLVPGDKRGMNGRILDKARRLRTLQLLAQSADGQKLAKSWGVPLKSRILRSLDADVESLLQYAVEHVSGGYYYPNAVMPWRGLLESELYAHSLLCDLLTGVSASLRSGSSVSKSGSSVILSASEGSLSSRALTIAEGIRLWLMVQKETQQWGTDAAFLEAIASVLRGTAETLDTKVILLSGSFTKPFKEVKAAGNGYTVECSYAVNGKPLADGDVLRVGDKVTASYRIWSEENRSFVRLTAPRPASLRPVNQLSGNYGWWLRPFSIGGWSFSPQGYRNVLAEKTEYWFDSYPEENTTITEEFFVTQEGAFQMPAVEIESLYAPHYRANGPAQPAILSEASRLSF